MREIPRPLDEGLKLMLINRNKQHRNTSGEKGSSPSHRFSVGQNVRLSPDMRGSSLRGENYRVVGHLPLVDRFPQYRIRNLNEPYERVVTEDRMTEIKDSIDDRSKNLFDKTFGSNK
ncbi:MAG: hypothetical protein K5905_26900 [Roseibium sp.]|uniref:hypothetical protein n=1 Tax=Roseibium sp. TaxID=1936156 RepID=UPI002623288C|nr:hypothetical protein [Roseibium sp.]MCV0429098.1 hypothetical protein [Roseibium sp.]